MAEFYRGILTALSRRKGWILAVTLVAGYGWMALRGPQGLGALFEKHREIRKLEEDNARKVRDNKDRRERVERLENSTSEQEMEIRKQLKLLRPGETTFILPDPPKSAEDASQPPGEDASPSPGQDASPSGTATPNSVPDTAHPQP